MKRPFTRRPAPGIKCGRSACQRRSADPKADGWTWLEAGSAIGLKTGWWCPECVQALQRLFAEHGVPPETERLN
jgi:hypothetical protein